MRAHLPPIMRDAGGCASRTTCPGATGGCGYNARRRDQEYDTRSPLPDRSVMIWREECAASVTSKNEAGMRTGESGPACLRKRTAAPRRPDLTAPAPACESPDPWLCSPAPLTGRHRCVVAASRITAALDAGFAAADTWPGVRPPQLQPRPAVSPSTAQAELADRNWQAVEAGPGNPDWARQPCRASTSASLNQITSERRVAESGH